MVPWAWLKECKGWQRHLRGVIERVVSVEKETDRKIVRVPIGFVAD